MSSIWPVKYIKNILLGFLSMFDTPLEKLFWNIMILLLFSLLYYFFVTVRDNDKERRLTLEEAFYFTFTVHFTVGFGDFSPINLIGRILFIFHVFLVWLINMIPLGLLNLFNNANMTDKPEESELLKNLK